MADRRRSARVTGSRASSVAASDVTATPRRSTRILGPVHEQYQAQLQADQAAQPQHGALNASGRGARSRGRGSALPTPPAGRGRGARGAQGAQSVVSTQTGNVSASFAMESGMNSDVDVRQSGSGKSSDKTPVVQEASNEEEESAEEGSEEEESEEEEADQINKLRGQQGSDRGEDRIPVIYGREEGYISFLHRFFPAVFAQFLRLLRLLLVAGGESVQWIWSQPIFLVCMVLATVLGGAWTFMDFSQLTSGPDLGHRFADVRYSIGQITSLVTLPLASLNDAAIRTIGVKVDGLQDQINRLDSRSVLTDEAVSQIERIVREPILLKIDEEGNPEIPLEFWNELKRRLIFELPHLAAENYEKYVRDMITYNKWDEWNVKNRLEMRYRLDNVLTHELQQMAKNTGMALFREDEIIKLIEKRWEEIGESLYPKMREIHKSASAALRDSSKAKDLAVNVASQISSGKFFAHAQNIAMADYHIQQLTDKVPQRVNHFSPLQGAVISPGITSPSYEFSKERANFITRILLGHPSPNPPISALTKWDEAGECWCAPNKRGGQIIGVLLSHDLIPDEIVIEHVPKTATLDPGAMPKHMEMYVRIQEQEKLWAYHEQSELQFPEKEDRQFDEHWVRIAKFTYDKDGTPTQRFPVLFAIEPFVSVRHVAIRALDNWGDIDHTCMYRVRLHGEVVPFPDSDENAA